MIGFYLDENVEGQITRGLRARGVDVLTAEEDGYDAMPDPQVLDRAGGLGRVAFSRDQDERFVGVVYAHKTQVRIGQCVADLELLAQAGAPDDFANRVYFLPL